MSLVKHVCSVCLIDDHVSELLIPPISFIQNEEYFFNFIYGHFVLDLHAVRFL